MLPKSFKIIYWTNSISLLWGNLISLVSLIVYLYAWDRTLTRATYVYINSVHATHLAVFWYDTNDVLSFIILSAKLSFPYKPASIRLATLVVIEQFLITKMVCSRKFSLILSCVKMYCMQILFLMSFRSALMNPK